MIQSPDCLGDGSAAPLPVAPRSTRKLAEGKVEWTETGLGHVPLGGHREGELDRRKAYVAKLNGRIVWLDLSKREGLKLIGKVDGPITFRVENLHDAWVVKTIGRLSKRFPVGISWVPNGDPALRPLLALPNLQMVELRQPSGHPGPIKFLRGMSGLRTLRWAGAFPEDEMQVVSTLHNLRVLDLNYTQLTDGGVAQLASLTDLQELDVSSGSVTDAGLRHLLPLKHLRRLRLSDYRITDAGLALLPGFPELRELVAEGANASDASLLVKLPNLEVLAVPRFFGEDAVPYINRMRNLRELDLSWCNIPGESSMKLDLPALERLKMNYTPGVVMHFAKRGTLHALDLSGPLLGEGDLHALEKLPNLRELRASVEGVDLPFLASLPQLETLNLHGNVADAELQALRASKSLHSLDLSYAPNTARKACDALPEFFFCQNRLLTIWEIEGRRLL